MAEAIAAETRQYGMPAPSDVSEVTFTVDTSPLMPGLTYVWGRFSPAMDARFQSVAASRGDTATIIRGIPEWWAALGTWRPGDAAAARQACLEMIRVTRDGWSAPRSTYFHPDSVPDSVFFESRALIVRKLRNLPMIHRSDDGSRWMVAGWVVRPTMSRVATYYRCTLPAQGGSALPELAEVDSLLRWDK